MKNFVQKGSNIQLTAPVGGVVGGQAYKQGSLIGVVVASAAEGEQFTLQLEGAFSDLPKETGTAWAIGDPLYWDAGNSRFTKTASANTFAGYAHTAALSAAADGVVLLSH